jgi:hypothetical protein
VIAAGILALGAAAYCSGRGEREVVPGLEYRDGMLIGARQYDSYRHLMARVPSTSNEYPAAAVMLPRELYKSF